MKKFFKALAVVLALTLIIGTIPAAAADGVAGLSASKQSKVLYIGGSKALTAEDAKCKLYNRYTLSKLVTGFDKDTMKVELATSDKAVVAVNNKTGRMYAKAIGSATVTVTVKDIDNDDLLLSFDVAVTVKKNATADTLTIKSDDVVDGAKLGINKAYEVVLPRKADGAFVDTDARALTCADENVKIEVADPKKPTTFTVTFLKEGEYTLKAAAFQSAKYPKYATPIEKEIKVTAGIKAESVKLVATDKVAVTFDCALTSAPAAENFKAYFMVNDIAVGFSSVKEVKLDENNADTAFVQFYRDFSYDVEMNIMYNDAVIGSVKNLPVTADSVAAVIFYDQEVVAGEETLLNYELVDANGVDITAHVGKELVDGIAFTLDRESTDAYVLGKSIMISNVGDSYKVKATYTWINKDGKEEKREAEATVTAKAGSPEISAFTAGVYAKGSNPNVKVDGKADDDVKAVANFTMSEDKANAFQFSVVVEKDGNFQRVENLATPGLNRAYKYEITSSNQNVIMPYGRESGKYYSYLLTANQPGTVAIYVTDESGDVIYVSNVTVKAAREDNTLTVTPSNLTINRAYSSDAIDFTIDMKDQYEEGRAINSVSIKQTAGADKISEIDTAALEGKKDTTKGYKVTLTPGMLGVSTGDGLFHDGTVNLEFTVNGKTYPVIRIKVVDDAGGADDVQTLKLSATSIKTGIKDDTTDNPEIVISLTAKTKNGNVIGGKVIGWVALADAPKAGAATSADNTYYSYTISKDGKEGADLKFFDYGTNTIVGLEENVATASKLTPGTYTVQAYKVVVKDGRQIIGNIGTQSFTVEDDQIGLEVKQVKDSLDGDSLKTAFEVKFNGTDVTDYVDFNKNDGADGYFVKSIDYTFSNAKFGYCTVSKAVGASIGK